MKSKHWKIKLRTVKQD